MTQPEMAQNLWSLTNTICGFAVLQGIAFALALGKDLANLQDADREVKHMIRWVAFVFAILYIVAVWVCSELGSSLDKGNEWIWTDTSIGRSIAILAFTGLGIGGLFAKDLFGKQDRT